MNFITSTRKYHFHLEACLGRQSKSKNKGLLFRIVHWVILLFKYLQNPVNPNRKSQGAEILRACSSLTMHHMSHDMCQVSGVICQVSGVNFPVSGVTFFSFFSSDQVVELVCGGSVINRAPSSFLFLFFLLWTKWWSQSVEGLLSTAARLVLKTFSFCVCHKTTFTPIPHAMQRHVAPKNSCSTRQYHLN